jgi:transposase
LIDMERRVLLRHYLEQEIPKAEIARRLGISRETIYAMIRKGELDRDPAEVRYSPRPPIETKLDPFKPILAARLEEFPDLTAVRLFEEIRAAGYTGGLTQLRDYLRRTRPQPPVEEVVRFETPPARQAQVDFAHFRFPWGVRYALLVVLGYSRLLWLGFFPRQDMRVLQVGLEQAFSFFGGVPQELLFDQMRAVIQRDLRPEGGRLVENAEFLRFSAHWGFRARACRPIGRRRRARWSGLSATSEAASCMAAVSLVTMTGMTGIGRCVDSRGTRHLSGMLLERGDQAAPRVWHGHDRAILADSVPDQIYTIGIIAYQGVDGWATIGAHRELPPAPVGTREAGA